MRTRGETKSGESESCQTRQAILNAAQVRFLHYGFKKTTIDEIAQDAGVGKGTVYLYFDGKDEILLTIVRTVKRNVTEQMAAIAGSPITQPEEKLRRMLLTAILLVHDACTSSAHGVELMDEEMRPNVIRCGDDEKAAQRQLIAGVLRTGVQRGDFALPGDDADLAARHLMLALVSFYPPTLAPCHADVTCRGSLESRVTQMLDFLMGAVRRR